MINHFKKIRYLAIVVVIFLASCAATTTTKTASTAADVGASVDFFRAVRANNASGVQSMIKQGFNPNIRDDHGQIALVMAQWESAARALQVLLDSSVTDVNLTNANDENALMIACLKGNKPLVDQLLAHGAAVNKSGWTPLHYAATSGQVQIMRTLIEDHHAAIDAKSPNGTTPLMMAAGYGNDEAVKLLLAKGASATAKNQLGCNAAGFVAYRLRQNDGDRNPSGAIALCSKSALRPATK
ncbi:MAG: ankyrin repeat domain-containing protein [Burkholderiaceae bacterium]|jgi:ankyrin repeat protein|nr:ankyrin repeat domain-containing protein [Burkholderiaceae bacterium]